MRETDIDLNWTRKAILLSSGTAVATFLGPFGTYVTHDFLERLVFWSLDMFVAALCMHLALAAVFSMRFLDPIAWQLRWVGAVMIGALPVTMFIFGIYGVIGSGGPLSMPFALIWSEVVLISLPITLIDYVYWPADMPGGKPRPERPANARSRARRRPPPSGATLREAPEAGRKPPALLARVTPERQSAEVISLSMQDHYVEVTTTEGSELLLMRLGDAIDLLEGLPGARIHRSHWVARDHVAEMRRNGRKHEVVLSDGRVLPVSASHVAAATRLLGG